MFHMVLPFVFLLSLWFLGISGKQEAMDDFLYDHPKSGVAIWAGAIVLLSFLLYCVGGLISRMEF
jgi:uncharacterized BrkB/YihY/UPF0761 family membrane protein